MISDLSNMLLSVGVVYQFIEVPDKFPLYGVTRWVNKTIPLIQQTGRLKTDGAIIWTLFHEIGHLLNDQSKETIFEVENGQNTKEREKVANSFAKKALFGAMGFGNFYGLSLPKDIERKAKEIGICPGLAVYGMHRQHMLDYKYGNKLMKKPSIPFAS